ncbi:hypothetical protein J2W96_005252 [Variovorax guangxiensis]|nr:hypothetical protein [Variovorax guangxiensis]
MFKSRLNAEHDAAILEATLMHAETDNLAAKPRRLILTVMEVEVPQFRDKSLLTATTP